MAKSTVAVKFTGEGAGLQGVLADLDSKFGGIGQKITSAVGPAGLALGGVASAAAGVGVALFKVGSDFDEQFDKIRVGTGKTGTALKGLEGDFKNVLKTVPTDFGHAGDAITLINQKLGLTGKPLQTIAEQMLELSRITKTDLTANLQGATGVFAQFGVSAAEQSGKLDELFRASQATGVSFTELTSQMAAGGPVFKSLNFSMADAAQMVGSLGKAGLSASDVLPGLSKVLAAGAKEGKSAQQTYRDLVASIKEAPDATTAAKIGFDELGAKAGPKFAELVRSGQLGSEELFNTIAEGHDTIMGASKDTQDFGEKWELIKNRVLVALEPVATAVFNGIGNAMDRLGPIIDNDIVPAFQKLSAWWQQNGPAISATVKQVFDTISQVIQAAVAIISALWNTFGSTIMASIKGTFEAIRSIIQGAMDVIQGIIKTVTALIHGDWGQAWDGIKQIFSGVWEIIKGIVQKVMSDIKALISAGWIVIKGVFTGALDGIKNAVTTGFGDIVSFVKGVPGKIVGALGNVANLLKDAGLAIIKSLLNGIKQGFEDVKHFVGGIAHTISNLKGPLEYDATLLNPHGSAIMQSLMDGLQDRYGPLLDMVQGIANAIAQQFHIQAPDLSSLGSGLSGTALTQALAGQDIAGTSAREMALQAANAVGNVIHITVQGSLVTEDMLLQKVRQGLASIGSRNPALGF